jgi:hypothetical protein
LVKSVGDKKRVSNDEFLLIKQILLSFPQFLFLGAPILHEVAQRQQIIGILLTNLKNA